MAAIEDGLYHLAMKARMAELESEKAEITARLAETPHHVPDIHPGTKRGEIHATTVLMGILDFANDSPSPDATRGITSIVSGLWG